MTDKVLLTGASGFLGRHVTEVFLKHHWEVYAIDNTAPLFTRDNYPNWHHYQADWLYDRTEALKTVKMIMDQSAPEYGLHLAWYTLHQDYWTSLLNQTWVDISSQLIRMFYQNGGRRLIGIGSCAEYNVQSPAPWKESTTPLYPESPYGKAKLQVYQYLEELFCTLGIDYAWARIFFVYGPYDRGNRLVPYILQSWARQEIPLVKNPSLKRDYIFIEDLARQLFWITTAKVNGAVNTGSGTATMIADLAKSLANIMGREDDIRLGSSDNEAVSPDQSMVIESDVSKLIDSGYKNQLTTLDEGLRKTCRWFQEQGFSR